MTKFQMTLSSVALAAGTLATSSDASACNRRNVTYNYGYSHVPAQVTVPAPAPIQAVVVRETYTTTVSKVEHVAPAPVKVPALIPGETFRLKVPFLGKEAGVVRLTVGTVQHTCEIHDWTPSLVVFTLPTLGVTAETRAHIEVLRPTGDLVKKLDVILKPEEEIDRVDLSVVKGN